MRMRLTSRNLYAIFPFLQWFPLPPGALRGDLLAGITVALVLVPQSMAYAQLAGLPPYYGLYAALVPAVAGALWGSSRFLATGPVAVVSLLTASALVPLAAVGSSDFIVYAALLAVLVGVVQLALGFLRLGVAVNVISHPVIIGFTNAAALIIALSQLSKLFGIPMGRSDHFFLDIWRVLLDLGTTHLPTLAMGLGSLTLLVLFKRFAPRWPGVLITVAIAIFFSWWTHYDLRANVTPEAIQDAEVQRIVLAHQAAAARAEDLEQRAAELRERTATTGDKEDGRSETLKLSYDLALLDIEKQDIEQENRVRAKLIRHFSFARVTTEGQPDRYYLAHQVPSDTVSDGRRWRINKVTDDSVSMVGGGEVVGTIPAGLPAFTLPHWDWERTRSLLSSALVIALVGFMEAISIAKALGARRRQRVDPNQELIGQGLANLSAGISQGYPVSGSFSRSAVNFGSGAVSGLSSVFAALVVLVTLLFLTPLLYHLPQATLAAIIMMAVVGLINVEGIKHAWQVNLTDGIAAVATFVTTLVFAPHLDAGILIGVGITVTLFLARTMRPRAEVVARHPDGALRGIKSYGLSPLSAHFVALRFDGSLNFMNVSYFEDVVVEAQAAFPQAKALLVIGSGINWLDASGEDKIRAIAARLQEAGIELMFSGLKKQVVDTFKASGLDAIVGRDNLFNTKEEAIAHLTERYGPEATTRAG
ncbi:MAG: SulP family inorganic anion transporter [Gammaproteobacteria bacterium]